MPAPEDLNLIAIEGARESVNFLLTANGLVEDEQMRKVLHLNYLCIMELLDIVQRQQDMIAVLVPLNNEACKPKGEKP